MRNDLTYITKAAATTVAAAIVLFCASCSSRSAVTDDNVISSCGEYTVYADSVVQGRYYARALTDRCVEAEYLSPSGLHCTGWHMADTAIVRPAFHCPQLIVDAVYNIGIGELEQSLYDEDYALSIWLSLAYLEPEKAMGVLRSKIADGRIAVPRWPLGSGCAMWVVAAWEVYKVTGDTDWLREIYPVIERSLAADYEVCRDKDLRIMHGMAGAMRWHEAGMPGWMNVSDLYQSYFLDTNVAYVKAYAILATIGHELGDDRPEYTALSRSMTNAVNNLMWIPDRGYYCGYLYGGVYAMQSPVSDNMGQAMSVLFGVATPDMARSLVMRTPVLYSGVPYIFPYPDGRDMRLDSYSPLLLQSVWNMAAARTDNGDALEAGIGALLRRVALCGLRSADWRQTLDYGAGAGVVSTVFRIIAGMEFLTDGIGFHPVILPSLSGDKVIENFRYREADLDIIIHGTGSRIARFSIDGAETDVYRIPVTLKGHHRIEITMANNSLGRAGCTLTDPYHMPPVPDVRWSVAREARIVNYTQGIDYEVYYDGVLQDVVAAPEYNIGRLPSFTVVDFVPVGSGNCRGFMGKPYNYIPEHRGSDIMIQAPAIASTGTKLLADRRRAEKVVESAPARHARLPFTVDTDTAATYFLDVSYSNGSVAPAGGVAVRNLFVNGVRTAALVMPSLGKRGWSRSAFSNMVSVELRKGVNALSIDCPVPESYGAQNDTVLIRYVRLIKN